MLIGCLMGFVTTFLNSKKKSLNINGVVDTLGSIFIFLIPSVCGAIFSSILFTTTAYGPYNDNNYVQANGNLSRWAQGGYQLIAMLFSIGSALLSGLIIGGINRWFGYHYEREDYFSDDAYVKKDNHKELQQTKVVKLT